MSYLSAIKALGNYLKGSSFNEFAISRSTAKELVESYESLKAERDALAAKVERFAVQCAAAKIAVQYAKSDGFECTLNTPDIDAHLNSVRAEGVEMFLASLNGATELWHPDAALEEFAAQLRSGKDGE